MKDKIVVLFSGWIEGEPEEYTFQYCGHDDSKDGIITGDEYVALSDEDRGEYILENLSKQIAEACDGAYEDIQVEVQ
jgi:hypothetical protein